MTRIILVPVFMVFVSMTQIGTEDFNPHLVFGSIVFAAASFTDFSGRHLACNMVTDFGKFCDRWPNKLLTTVAFIYMRRAACAARWCSFSSWPVSCRPVCGW